jgi:hypothetical protein
MPSDESSIRLSPWVKKFARSGDMIGWQLGGMRPTAYGRNARGLRDRQAFELLVASAQGRPGRYGA